MAVLCITLAACASDSLSPEPGPSAGNSDGRVADARGDVGRVRIIDGDTLVLDGQKHRLFGIDSPESSQTCLRKDKSEWPCGQKATKFLTHLVLGQQLHCREVPGSRDRYGRQVSLCELDGLDINRQMVISGHAWAYRRYSSRYIDAERQAKMTGLGVWQGASEPPWHIRQKRFRQQSSQQAQKPSDLSPASSGCLIKGNISTGGKIFHLPGSRDYDKTTINAARGERWFCTAAEAQLAGWRARR